MTRRKLSPNPIAQGTDSRPLRAATETRSQYAGVLARARALGLYAAFAIAPLGLAGSVSACGAARPVERTPHYQPGNAGEPVPPVETIAPPGAAPSSSAPVPAQSE